MDIELPGTLILLHCSNYLYFSTIMKSFSIYNIISDKIEKGFVNMQY